MVRLLVVLLYLLVAGLLPMEIHRGLYTMSLVIKEGLLWVLPLTVCILISYAISSFEKNAPLFVILLILFEFVSNMMGVWYASAFGYLTITPVSEVKAVTEGFTPLWDISFARPSWWSASRGVFMGVILGLMPWFRGAILLGKQWVEFIITRLFSKIAALFIIGFIARLYHMQTILWNGYLILCLVSYIGLIFLIGSGLRGFLALLPAGGMAFMSGCSISTMPWTISGTGKSLRDPELAKAVIPATTNVQQIGDCIVNVFLCFMLYTQWNGHVPSLQVWVPFTIAFVVARFATAAVLGGAIFVMLPIP